MSDPQSNSRHQFLKMGAAAAIGFGVASAVEIPVFAVATQNDKNEIDKKNAQIAQLQPQADAARQTQTQLISAQALKTLGVTESSEVEAIVETVIPTDSAGPGGKEAGVLYFIDQQLAGDYGTNARMYVDGPFVASGLAGPISVRGVDYAQGTFTVPYTGPTYQYNMTLREFWRTGLLALETYSNSTYGNNFENLSNSQRTQVLTDLYNNKPTSFNDIVPRDFFNEILFMTWSGFLMDPAYGGNINLVGWKLTGFTGANMGDTFSEGRDSTALMVASSPTRFPPHGMGEFQAAISEIPP